MKGCIDREGIGNVYDKLFENKSRIKKCPPSYQTIDMEASGLITIMTERTTVEPFFILLSFTFFLFFLEIKKVHTFYSCSANVADINVPFFFVQKKKRKKEIGDVERGANSLLGDLKRKKEEKKRGAF